MRSRESIHNPHVSAVKSQGHESVSYLSLCKLWFDVLPRAALCRVTEQVHDNRALADGFIDLEEVGAGYPTILLRLLPAGTVFPHANDNVEAVVAQVQSLAVALRAVADEGEGIILEVVLFAYRSAICLLQIGGQMGTKDARESCHEASHRALFINQYEFRTTVRPK